MRWVGRGGHCECCVYKPQRINPTDSTFNCSFKTMCLCQAGLHTWSFCFRWQRALACLFYLKQSHSSQVTLSPGCSTGSFPNSNTQIAEIEESANWNCCPMACLYPQPPSGESYYFTINYWDTVSLWQLLALPRWWALILQRTKHF